jgi:NAD(P)-dependent dehydrogenase (short-subunit alcohol dehydrogenase family)
MLDASRNPQRLDGKVAIITGATGGIGEATARLFLELGAKVMLVGRSSAKLAETCEGLNGGSNCATAVAEAGGEAAIRGAVAAAVDRFGALNIMVANAGTEGNCKPVEELAVEDFEEVLRVNVTGVWLAIKHAAAPIKAGGGGAIVALSSIAGVIGFPALAPYVASKHAVFGLVKVAAMELGPANIRVNAVAPGPVDNRMIQSLADQIGGGDPAGFRAFVESRIPMGRYGKNEEIAQLITFLSSDAASYCNGGLYLADGGYVAA